MKLAELGLKTKPATKYFDHGYISFRTLNKELSFRITIFDSRKNPFLESGWKIVKDQKHLKDLFAFKTVYEVVNQ